MLAYAKAMTYWHRCHRFCGNCGSPTVSTQGGHLRVCTNPQCGQHHFPRTDPAIIVLVTSGERCLLGRQQIWPAGRYSIIAGFVEPGESLEAAVAREVREETGIAVEQVRYWASQPWPFPSSLMLGFRAEAASTSVQLRDGELEAARWLSREEIAIELRQGALRLPPEVSISYQLIESWFDAGGLRCLKHLVSQGAW
jgi:NAD+ diphosphatase